MPLPPSPRRPVTRSSADSLREPVSRDSYESARLKEYVARVPSEEELPPAPPPGPEEYNSKVRPPDYPPPPPGLEGDPFEDPASFYAGLSPVLRADVHKAMNLGDVEVLEKRPDLFDMIDQMDQQMPGVFKKMLRGLSAQEFAPRDEASRGEMMVLDSRRK